MMHIPSRWIRLYAVSVAATLLVSTGCGHGAGDRADSTPFAASADSVSPPDAAGGWALSPKGAGPLRIGMTFTEAAEALGVVAPDTATAPRNCAYIAFAGMPADLRTMWVEGKLARMDVDSTSIATTTGVRVGDAGDRVQSLYPGQVTVQPHKYVPSGQYLIITPTEAADSGYRLIFETDSGKVTRFRGGAMPQVEWVEGCS